MRFSSRNLSQLKENAQMMLKKLAKAEEVGMAQLLEERQQEEVSCSLIERHRVSLTASGGALLECLVN